MQKSWYQLRKNKILLLVRAEFCNTVKQNGGYYWSKSFTLLLFVFLICACVRARVCDSLFVILVFLHGPKFAILSNCHKRAFKSSGKRVWSDTVDVPLPAMLHSSGLNNNVFFKTFVQKRKNDNEIHHSNFTVFVSFSRSNANLLIYTRICLFFCR